ncbi:MAG TPA: SMP-30/gluconolactonase/LRE family protein [Bryobacteraceae bacterium]|nr:SMP-30/gluconolactonase/LRE family protein [Bryobacteraceae bacterium]
MPQLTSGRPNYEAEKIAINLQFVDGLSWSRSGFLAFADVRQRRIFRLDSDPHPKVLKDNDGGASGLAYDPQGRLYICESESRRITRLEPGGKLNTLAENWQGKKFNAPNDIAVRKDGHVYFTDPAFGSANDRRDLDFYGIWHISPKGDLDVAAKWQTRPNGVAVSGDGKVLFVTDSDRHAVVAFDLDRNGAVSNQRDVIKNVAGVPGGIRTDVDGRFYVAAKGIAVYSPQGRLERTLLESENTSNCAFGEGDLETLFVAARGNIFRVKLGVKGALQY